LLGDRRELIEDSKYPIGVDGMHMADLASDEFERDLDLSLLSAEEDALFEVVEAMRRIESGSYGVCEVTGKPIPLARLRAIPWTRFTAEAELELERLGAVDKAHLGKLRRVEIEPTALSRELERIQPSETEISAQSLEKLAESIEPASDEEPPSRTSEPNESDRRS
jgi:RNA polymerase-binding transcription factor DksA